MNKYIFNIKKLSTRLNALSKPAWTLISLVCLSAMITVFFIYSASTYPVGWEQSFPVTPIKLSARNISVESKGSVIAAVYEGETKNIKSIFISLSLTGGKDFLQPIKIADIKSAANNNPKAAISGQGHIAVVWQNLPEGETGSRMYFSVSINMGASWTQPVRIMLPTEMELLPQIYYDERNILHIFYNAFQESSFNLFHISSSDEKTFEEPRALVKNFEGLRGAFFPAVHFSENYCYVVWQAKTKQEALLNDELYFIRSDNYAKSWSSKKQVSTGRGNSSTPYITSYQDNIYLVYVNNEFGNWAVKLLKGYEHGANWDQPMDITTTNADCYSPSVIRSEGDDLVFFWYDSRNKTSAVFSKKYSAIGKKLSTAVQLSKSAAAARKPSPVATDKSILVLWEEKSRLIAISSDISVAAPEVYSLTHPENVWERSGRAVIKWKSPRDESGIAGYATQIRKPDETATYDYEPVLQTFDGNITEMLTPELPDGITTFYIRAIDGAGNFSRTVQYNINISKNPLPMPSIESPTHADGKAAQSNSPMLKWTSSELDRLKGFQYSLSKDLAEEPKIFTNAKEISFSNLANGRYFFKLKSIDKTNASSKTALYQIIVGTADELDAGELDKIAKLDAKAAKQIQAAKNIVVKIKKPEFDIDIPFDTAVPFQGNSFNAKITAKNISEKNIVGYSSFVGSQKAALENKINLNKKFISISDLTNGNYFIGIKCRYFVIADGKKKFYWSEPVYKQFAISTPALSPALAYMDQLAGRLKKTWLPVSVSMTIMLFSAVGFGFGARVPFYTKLVQVKVLNIFKI